MPNGFEWPEFRPGDRVMVRRPSEEAPPSPCGCKPVDAWDHFHDYAPDVVQEGAVSSAERPIETMCPRCGGIATVRGYYIEGPDGHGVIPGINLELLEAATDD